MGHSWFRIAGASTISIGASGSFGILQFEHEGTSYLFKEKAGRLPAGEISARLPEVLRPAATWPDSDESIKEFPIGDDVAGKIFQEGAYAYFPSSRAESPNWLNRESVSAVEFNLAAKFAKRLGKPLYVENSLEKFQQWLLSIILEARHDVVAVGPSIAGGEAQLQLVGNVALGFSAGTVLGFANELLRRILDDPNARFGWLGRHGTHKLGIATGSELKVPSIDALSAGQSTLLGIFELVLAATRG